MTFISENNIANLYSAIIEMPIFDEYKLPPASKVDFVIVDDDSICGEYQPPEQGDEPGKNIRAGLIFLI